MFIEGRAASVAFPFFILILTCMGIFCKIFYDSGMLGRWYWLYREEQVLRGLEDNLEKGMKRNGQIRFIMGICTEKWKPVF